MKNACDTLIIGGGSAGCVLARRLAERRSGTVVLLEAGKPDEGDPAATDLKRLDEQTAGYDWGFAATTLAGGTQQLNYARARLLGGCANHNDCAFIRPPDSDFDQWESLGATGWNAAAMAPMWDRLRQRVNIEPATLHKMSRAFIAAGEAMGLPRRDFSREVAEGVGPFPLNATGRLRQSSSVTYLHPLAQLPHNLEVRTGSMALRLLFEGTRVVGVETSDGIIHANRVVLACGAIQTPQLLMVSGIGPEEELRRHGITLVQDNEHVGAHLQDHVAAPVVWQTREEVTDWDICPFEATMMLKLEDDAPAPDILFHFGLRVREKYRAGERFPHKPGFAVKASPNVTRARSEGRITLRSADMRDAPHISLNFFSDPYDLTLLRKALKFTRQLFETNPFSTVLEKELYPGPGVQTDDQWDGYIKSVCETVYHPCCTAAIGKVVDAKLKVDGVDNLFIADASVFPSLITVNINSAVMMVAERAADLLA